MSGGESVVITDDDLGVARHMGVLVENPQPRTTVWNVCAVFALLVAVIAVFLAIDAQLLASEVGRFE